MKKIKKLNLFAAIFAVVFGCIFTVSALAAEDAPISKIVISPPYQKINLIPGDNYRGVLTITNPNDADTQLAYSLRVSPYSITNGNYDSPDIESGTAYTQMTDWITFDWTEGVLNVGESVEVPYTISVPMDAPAGGQYAMLLARGSEPASDDGQEGFNVGNIKQIGSIIYASVAGETRQSGSITENKLPGFSLKAPFKASSTIDNTGNVHADASYILQVFPMFSDEEVYTNEENPEVKLVMPDTKYYHEVAWENPPMFGIFRAKQTIQFLDQNSVTEKIVVICPTWLLVVFLVAICAAIYWLISRSKSRKKSRK